MSKVISVMSNKGGSSKTTLVLNIAGYLSKEGKVCVVDLDSQMNTTIVLGGNTNKNIEDFLLRGNDLSEVKSESNFEGIFKVEGSEGINRYLSESNLNVLSELIEELKKEYDFVIIDTAPSLDEKIKRVMLLSDLVIVPVLLDLFSVRGLQSIIKEYEPIKTLSSKMLVVPVQVIHNSKLHREVYKQLEEYVKRGKEWLNLSKWKISYSVEVSNSLARNEILTLGSRSKVGRQLNKLGKEVLSYVR